jgi:hypothetical protein
MKAEYDSTALVEPHRAEQLHLGCGGLRRVRAGGRLHGQVHKDLRAAA